MLDHKSQNRDMGHPAGEESIGQEDLARIETYLTDKVGTRTPRCRVPGRCIGCFVPQLLCLRIETWGTQICGLEWGLLEPR
jgi:hypothetical protein